MPRSAINNTAQETQNLTRHSIETSNIDAQPPPTTYIRQPNYHTTENESLLDSSILRKVDNARQGSSSNGLFDVNDTLLLFVHSGPKRSILIFPHPIWCWNGISRLWKQMNDVREIGNNLGCMESFGSEAIVQKKATPRAQEAILSCVHQS